MAPEATRTVPVPRASTTDADVTAWGHVLAELQEQVASVGPDMDEEAVAQMAAWKPPADLGPIPHGLADWARALLADMQVATAALERGVTENRQQARMAHSVPPARERGLSTYLDVQA